MWFDYLEAVKPGRELHIEILREIKEKEKTSIQSEIELNDLFNDDALKEMKN